MSNETKGMLDRVEANCKLLWKGWREKVEYKIPVKYHDKETCAIHRVRAATCECPVENESRTRSVNREGLIQQLREYTKNVDADLNPKAARGAPRVKTPKLHPEMAGFLTLDEITCEAYTLLDRVFEEAGRDRTWLAQPIESMFMGLTYQVGQFGEERPDLAREVAKATDRWVAMAKTTLKLTVSDAMFGDMVCGNCGGGLAVAWDNSSEVRCIGAPDEPPCGETYPMSEWVSLYEKKKRDAAGM